LFFVIQYLWILGSNTSILLKIFLKTLIRIALNWKIKHFVKKTKINEKAIIKWMKTKEWWHYVMIIIIIIWILLIDLMFALYLYNRFKFWKHKQNCLFIAFNNWMIMKTLYKTTKYREFFSEKSITFLDTNYYIKIILSVRYTHFRI